MSKNQTKHLFAFHIPDLSIILANSKVGENILFKNAELWSRLIKVIRLKFDEQCIFFDNTIHVVVNLHSSTKSPIIAGTICKVTENKSLKPTITFLCPLLKREAFEHVVYVAAQMGINTITPYISQKCHEKELTPKEALRLHNIMIAACEQAKQYIIPRLEQPQKLDAILHSQSISSHIKIGFDDQSKPLIEMFKNIAEKKPALVSAILGPEGGFTSEEKNLLTGSGFCFYELTPTILRAREAAIVGLGCLRSISATF